MSAPDLTIVGDVNVDLVLAGGDVRPAFGQRERLVERADLVLGGSGAITACAAARLGLDVRICGVVGDDPFGEFCRRQLAAAGVDAAWVRIDPGVATGVSVILADAEDRAILTAPGAIGSLGGEDLRRLPDRPARHLHVSSYFLLDASARDAMPATLGRFREAGVTTSLDPNWDPAQRWDLGSTRSSIDVLLPNESELLALTGLHDVDEALRALTDPPWVVVKLGAGGAAGRGDGETHRVAAPPAPDFVDGVGAGDAFDAGYLAALLAGAGPVERLTWGVAAGTLSTRGAGGIAGQADLAEVRRLAAALR